MRIPPGPVTAAKSIGPYPSYCRADCPGTQRPAHPRGHARAYRRRGSGQPHCAHWESTLYLRRTCCCRRMTQMGQGGSSGTHDAATVLDRGCDGVDASCSVVTDTATLAYQGRRGGVHPITASVDIGG